MLDEHKPTRTTSVLMGWCAGSMLSRWVIEMTWYCHNLSESNQGSAKEMPVVISNDWPERARMRTVLPFVTASPSPDLVSPSARIRRA